MEKRKNLNQTGPGLRNDDVREGSSPDNPGRTEQTSTGFDDPNQKANYDLGKGSSGTQVRQTSTGKTEEGDEDYDDEDEGKDFSDYDDEYQEKNKGMD